MNLPDVLFYKSLDGLNLANQSFASTMGGNSIWEFLMDNAQDACLGHTNICDEASLQNC